MFFAILEGLIMGVVLVSVRHVWGHAYSDEEEVVTYVAKMVLVIAVSNFLDGIQSVLSGMQMAMNLLLNRGAVRLRQLILTDQLVCRCRSRLWVAEDLCLHQPRRVLRRGHTGGVSASLRAARRRDGASPRFLSQVFISFGFDNMLMA